MTEKSPEQILIEDYARQLQEIIEKYRFSQTVLAQKIGVSTSVISQVLKMEYPYKADNFAWSQIEKFIRLQSKKVYETKLLRIVMRALNRTFEEKKLTVLTGGSGAGKTTAVEHYGLYNKDALYIRVNETLTKKYLLALILRALSQPEYGNAFEMYCAVSECFRKKNKLLIIDEAERLSTGMLEMLRDLFDQGNMGLALVGLGTLSELLIKGRSRKENLVQLYSRVDYKEIVNILTPGDVGMVFKDLLPNFKLTDSYKDKLARDYEKRGGLRAIIKIANLGNKLYDLNKNSGWAIEDCIAQARQELDWRDVA